MNESIPLTEVTLPPRPAHAAPSQPMFYLLLGDQPAGPIPRTELSARVQRGEISGETLCATPGSDTWVKVSDVVPPAVNLTGLIAVRLVTAVVLFIVGPLIPLWFNVAYFWTTLAWIFGFVILVFTPVAIARKRQHPSRTAITVLSVVLGWTIIGWIVAMCWALSGADRK